MFVSDELSAGALRADIIALGRKAETYFPVFIELKVKRQLTRLKVQLELARDAMGGVPEIFTNYLSAVTGVEGKRIAFAPKLILAWPSSESGNESKAVSEARINDYITAEFQPDGRIRLASDKTDG